MGDETSNNVLKDADKVRSLIESLARLDCEFVCGF